MSRNTRGLRRGGPGRPKGSKNKATQEIKAWASELFHSEEWRESALRRINSGKAPHLEGHILQVLLPKLTKHEVSGPGGRPIQVITRVAQPV